jgi:hypothetical protein
MAKKIVRYKLYSVDWYNSYGFCYRTTNDCRWEDVLNCKRTAKALGDTIKYSVQRIVSYDYSY